MPNIKDDIIKAMLEAKGQDAVEVEDIVEDEDEFDEFEFDEEEEELEDDFTFDEEEEEEEEEAEEDEDDEEEVEEEVEVPKDHHAFAELRHAEKVAREEAAAKQRELEYIALSQGYKSVDEFMDAFKEAQLEKEAKEKGVADVEMYKRVTKLEKENEAIREEARAKETNGRVQKFMDTVDSVKESLGLSKEQVDEIINEIGEDGYGVEDLVKIKSPKRFIEGYAKDLPSYKKQIEDAAIQRYIASKERASKSSEKQIKGKTDGKLSIQDVIAMRQRES